MRNLLNEYELLKSIRSGKTPEEYASENGFKTETVWAHLVQMASKGSISAKDLLDEEEIQILVNILGKSEWDGRLRSMYNILGKRYSYDEAKLFLYDEEFLLAVKEELKRNNQSSAYLEKRIAANSMVKKNKELIIPGIYVYFVFGKSYDGKDSPLLFIDITRKLGKVIADCKDTAEKIGFIRAETIEEAKMLAAYYTSGMNPQYPSHTEDSIVTGIDEEKRRPQMIIFNT